VNDKEGNSAIRVDIIISATAEWQSIRPACPDVQSENSPHGQYFSANVVDERVLFFRSWGKVAAAGSTQYLTGLHGPSSLTVVNAEGKSPELPGQVTGKKRTAREPLVKCRNETLDDVQNRGRVTAAISSDDTSAYEWSGVRHEKWPELAMRRLNGTWEPEIPMLTEKPQVQEP